MTREKDYAPTLQLAKDEAMRLLHTYAGESPATSQLAGAILLAAVLLAERDGDSRE